MTYATQQDLIDRFGTQELARLTDPAAGATINTTLVDRALADADAEIDTRLAQRYTAPLSPVPTVVVRLAADIARYFLWGERVTEQVRTRYKDATSLLDRIGAGHAKLAGAELLTPAPDAVAVSVLAPARQFSSTLLDTFAPPQG